MAGISEWTSTLSRRSALRGGVLGLAGLSAAALLGCGGSKSAAPSGNSAASVSSGQGTDPASYGGPKNVKRADGFDPKLGEVAVNTN